jgi:hypothetical protein
VVHYVLDDRVNGCRSLFFLIIFRRVLTGIGILGGDSLVLVGLLVLSFGSALPPSCSLSLLICSSAAGRGPRQAWRGRRERRSN